MIVGWLSPNATDSAYAQHSKQMLLKVIPKWYQCHECQAYLTCVEDVVTLSSENSFKKVRFWALLPLDF